MTPASERPSAFPVTIEHKYGSTEIAQAPKRVVTVGLSDHDAVLALGVKPVAMRDWFGDQPYATWVWACEHLGDSKPAVLPSGELNFEQITALKPNLEGSFAEEWAVRWRADGVGEGVGHWNVCGAGARRHGETERHGSGARGDAATSVSGGSLLAPAAPSHAATASMT